MTGTSSSHWQARPTVRRAYDFLRLRGWRPAVPGVDRVYVENYLHEGLWLHPCDQVERTVAPAPAHLTPPPTGYETNDAVVLQILNDRVALLEVEGWVVEEGDPHITPAGRYWTHIRRMKSPASRTHLTLAHALERQEGEGFTAPEHKPVLPAVHDWHQGKVATWCAYCEAWHVATMAGCKLPLGHYVVTGPPLVCSSWCPYGVVGYRSHIVRSVPDQSEFFPRV